jgi:SAM-dependent methyltransferase
MSIAYRLSAANRHRKWALFCQTFPPDPALKILDVGFAEDEFSTTDNYLEKHFPYLENVTALGFAPATRFSSKYPRVNTVCYDGDNFPFADQSFDVVWSNAVVEHVGDFDRQVRFLSEIRRVGRRCFVTTPNRYFPFEVHTRIPLLHYLPKPTFDAILRQVGKGDFAGDYMHLSSERRFRDSLAAAGFRDFQFHRNRLAGFVVDFVAIG